MGLFKPKEPKAIRLFKRGDIPGLIEALEDKDMSTRTDASHALTLIGEPALPLLFREISVPAVPPGYHAFKSPRCLGARVAVERMGAVAVPHLMDAIRLGDTQLAKAADACLAGIEKGGVASVDGPTQPVAITYPDNVKAAFEAKVGIPLVEGLAYEETHD
jgi:hypothetical protein